MPDKKLTDNEIIKALEDWIKNYDGSYINFKILGNALDLITRQKTENENLKVENQSLRSAANSLKMHYEEAQAEIERLQYLLDEEEKKYTICAKHFYKEAIKEFAERLKYFIIPQKADGYTREIILKRDIDDLVKEMVGDDNA